MAKKAKDARLACLSVSSESRSCVSIIASLDDMDSDTFLAASSASRLVLSWSCMLLLSAIAPKETRLAVVSASSAARS